MWAWIVLAILLLLLITVNLMYVRVQFKYDLLWSGPQKSLKLVFVPVFKRFMWEKTMVAPNEANEWADLVKGLIKNKKEKNQAFTEDSLSKKVKRKKKISRVSFYDYYRLFRLFASHLVLERLNWKSSLGLDDAMKTALTCGGIWAFKGNFTAFISHFSSLQHVELEVQPVYNMTGFSSQLDSIFKIRIVYIMLIIFFASFISLRGYINGIAARKA